MSIVIGQDAGGSYSTWGVIRRPIVLPGNSVIFTQHSSEYLDGSAFHAGFKSAENCLLRGDRGKFAAAIGFGTGTGGNFYFYSNFFTGVGGNTENSIDESHALELVGQTLTLDGGTTFTITADYKDTLDGQLVLGPSPPGPGPSSLDIDTVGLLTPFNS